MLVVSRLVYETVCIGDEIKVHLLKAGNDSARIGIEAPMHYKILRGELCVPKVRFEPRDPKLRKVIKSFGKPAGVDPRNDFRIESTPDSERFDNPYWSQDDA